MSSAAWVGANGNGSSSHGSKDQLKSGGGSSSGMRQHTAPHASWPTWLSRHSSSKLMSAKPLAPCSCTQACGQRKGSRCTARGAER